MEEINYTLLAEAIIKKQKQMEKEAPKQEKIKEKIKEKPKERVVSHTYQEKTDILAKLTSKQKKEYISKEDLNGEGFPMDWKTTRKFFEDFEIGGRPWISYEQQLNTFVLPLMDTYKFKKGDKKAKLTELQAFLQGRIKSTEQNNKLSDYQKKPRIMSLELTWKHIGEHLGDL